MSQTEAATLISSPTGLGAISTTNPPSHYEESVPQIHFTPHHSHSDEAKCTLC